MKKLTILTLISSLTSLIIANDTYKLTYTQDNNCTLIKNGKSIELFDKRFKTKKPNSAYTCSAIQKEQYTNCKIKNSSNTSAQLFSFGSYEYTNLIIAFKNPSPSVNSSMEVVCTQEVSKN